ncbi:F-box only protein 6-like [Amphiura filiformis]|uniref:F-box only protein 6-like n=1 Tax=Amphiura filiformis TaxID=82378 RepID=UPI003B21C174
MALFYPSDWRPFYFKAPYTRNLIRNCSGQDGLKHGWNILENGGNYWKVEKDHGGSDDLPEEALALSNNVSYNFATSYGWCSMEQIIDLTKEGVSEELLDGEIQPDIVVTEWYAARFDCGNTYEMSVTLLTKPKLEKKYTLAEFNVGPVLTPQWAPRNWNKVEHVFCDYGPGLRYIRFFHKGKDTQFWAGHYGCKMAGAQVRIQFKEEMQGSRPKQREVIKSNPETQLTLKEDEDEDIYD